MYRETSYARIKRTLFLLPAWQRWLLTISLISILCVGWFIWFYAPLSADISCAHALCAQSMTQKKLVATYKKELNAFQETITSLQNMNNLQPQRHDSFIKIIADEAHNHGVDFQECSIENSRGHQQKTMTCSWCAEGEWNNIRAYITAIAQNKHNHILERLSIDARTGDSLHVAGIITEVKKSTK